MVVKKFEIGSVVVEGEGGVYGLGRYQAWQYVLALLPVMFTAMSQANFVFAAQAVGYRCLVPACESSSPSASAPGWWPPAVSDQRCSRPQLISAPHADNCTSDSFANYTEPCDAWVYDNGNSIVSELGLACEEWKRTLVGTVHNLGVLVAMPVMGYVSDRWGRRVAVIISSVGVVMGALKTLARGYLAYLAVELVEAALATGTYTTAFVLMLELVGQDKRTVSSFAMGVTIACGELLLSLAVWRLPYWRHFLLAIYCPAVLFLAYAFLLEESLRWLLVNNKQEQAAKLVQKIARWNNLPLTEKTVETVQDTTFPEEKGTEKFTLKLLFSSKTLMKRLAICAWWWFATAFVYYGLMINSVSLPGTPVANFVLTSVASVPGDLAALWALHALGRRRTLVAGFLFCALCCLANAFMPPELVACKIGVYLFGKAAIALCFNTIYVYTSELLPTAARALLLGACSMLARVGTVLAPLSPLLSTWWAPLPTVVFGCCALIAAALTHAAPETRRRQLPDTVAQANALV